MSEVTSEVLDAPWAEISPGRAARAVERNGLAIVRGMFGPAHTRSLAAGIDRAFAAFDAQDPADDWFVPFVSKTSDLGMVRNWVRQRGGVLAVDCPPMLDMVIDACRRTGIIEWVRTLLGEQPVLSSHKTTLRLTHPDTPSVGWHQDGAFMGHDARVLNIWLALSSCGVDAPGLDLSLRRQPGIVGAGEDGAPYEWSVSDARAAREVGQVISPVMASGDAIIFDHLCLHRTGALHATKSRKAIEAWFFAPSTLPDNYDAISL